MSFPPKGGGDTHLSGVNVDQCDLAVGEPTTELATELNTTCAGLGTASGGAYDSFVRSLHAEYANRLFAIVLRFTRGDWQWAEDVVQETLVRAWRNADRLSPERGSGSLMPWLVTVARRIVVNIARGRDVRPHDIDETVLARMSVPDETERVIHRLVVREALAKLTTAHRTVVVELYLRCRTVEEVADLVGVPPGTVKSRAHYAW
jgi:RNA polymerase sigma-70 factor (ECF subfamily)